MRGRNRKTGNSVTKAHSTFGITGTTTAAALAANDNNVGTGGTVTVTNKGGQLMFYASATHNLQREKRCNVEWAPV